MRGGYLTVGRWGGAPVRLHWTLPLGAFIFGQGRFAPGFWLGFCLIVLIHEIGHGIVVLRSRCRIASIDAHGLGGVCLWSGQVSPIARAQIAWGGVNAQFVALLGAGLALAVFGEPRTAFVADLAHAFLTTNLFIAAFNLLPFPPLDGAEAWKLPRLLRERRRSRRHRAAQRPTASRAALERELAALDARDRAPASTSTGAAVDAALGRIADEVVPKKRS